MLYYDIEDALKQINTSGLKIYIYKNNAPLTTGLFLYTQVGVIILTIFLLTGARFCHGWF